MRRLKIGGMSPDGAVHRKKVNRSDLSEGNLSWKGILFVNSLNFPPVAGRPHLRRGLEELFLAE
jgi:hypothetical protein